MLLGDAYVQPTGFENARLRLEHRIEHAEYLAWKVALLTGLRWGKTQTLERLHPITKRTYRYVRRQSLASPVLGAFRRSFYPEGRKCIPEDLADWLCDEIGLAIWFYDDGYYYKRDKCSYIYLGRVSLGEAVIASHAIAQRFAIVSKVLDKKRKGFALYFSPQESRKVKALVQKFNVPVMAYKIPFNPVTTAS